MLNPERFTGYAGESANRVWRAIYEENCFGLSEASLESGNTGSSSAALVNPFGRLSEGFGTEMIKPGVAALDDGDMCEEKRVYYRVISGELELQCSADARPARFHLHPHLPRVS